MRIGIVGLGLIGGAFAKAFHAHTGHAVYGADHDPAAIDAALRDGVLTGVLTEDLLPTMDLLLVALYPAAAIRWMEAAAPHLSEGAIVMDLCGVKRFVYPAFHRLALDRAFVYVGGHPMAGSERSGYTHARPDLFNGASMILTPTPEGNGHLAELERLFTAVGFRQTVVTTPEEHDRMIAYTSQLAHVLSNAYVKSPHALIHRGFSAGSFQDMTRVAYLNVDMWTELFLENGEYLAEEVRGLAARLTEYAEALEDNDEDRLRSLLADGKRMKELSMET